MSDTTEAVNPHAVEVLELDKAARAALPEVLRELQEATSLRDAAQTRMDVANATIKRLLRNTIKKHERLGSIGLTTMADGSKIYWLPDDEATGYTPPRRRQG